MKTVIVDKLSIYFLLKKCGFAFIIFVAGGNTFLNLSAIKYGSPNLHFEGSWAKVAASCAIAIFMTVLMVRHGQAGKRASRKAGGAGEQVGR